VVVFVEGYQDAGLWEIARLRMGFDVMELIPHR
jgi:hypothetical protein